LNERRFNLLAVGVGGQGVLSAVRALGKAAMEAGLDVRVGQLHGMARRGGSVEAMLVIGPGQSCFIPATQADVILALEPSEAQRAIDRMSPTTSVIINPDAIVPYGLTSRGLPAPGLDEIVERIETVSGLVHVAPCGDMARASGSPLALNTAMVGFLAGLQLSPIPTDAMRRVLSSRGDERVRAINALAFERGCSAGAQVRERTGSATRTPASNRECNP